MKQSVKLVVVMPIGPLGSRNNLDHMMDVIESIVYYTTDDRRIIIQDNSTPLNFGDRLKECYPELIVIRTPENYGLGGGLYKAESLAFMFADSMIDYQVMVRMDADALFTGFGLEDDAIAYFKEHPNAGQLGNRLESEEGTGWAREELTREMGVRGMVQDRKRAMFLRKIYNKAQDKGYQLGHHILGGVGIFNPTFVSKLVSQQLLLREEIRRSKLQEDHLFSLLCNAVGMEFHHWQVPDYPMAVAWKGLPDSPENLVAQNAKLVHSVRGWRDMNEDQVRAFFRKRRVRTI
jgi:hypothetical protein